METYSASRWFINQNFRKWTLMTGFVVQGHIYLMIQWRCSMLHINKYTHHFYSHIQVQQAIRLPDSPLSSSGSACAPVAVPVTMTPSERKNSAAWAVSAMLTSEVRAWALQWPFSNITHVIMWHYNTETTTLCYASFRALWSASCTQHTHIWSYLCFFLMSVKIWICSAPMHLR